jgi:hypothetical protein
MAVGTKAEDVGLDVGPVMRLPQGAYVRTLAVGPTVRPQQAEATQPALSAVELLDPLRGGRIADQAAHSHAARPGKLLLVLRFVAQLVQNVVMSLLVV